MKRTLALLLLAAVPVLAPTAASAQATCPVDDWTCESTETDVVPGGGGGGGTDHNIPGTGGVGYSPAFAPAGPGSAAILQSMGLPGDRCWQAVPDASSPMTYYDAQLAALAAATPEQPACPDLDTAVDPQVIRRTLWEQIQPPAPRPSVDPGKGITGLPVYLTIDGPREQVFEVTLFGVTYRLPGRCTYTVYWDAPKPKPATNGVDRSGVTYEDRAKGQPITWTYRDRGHYTIRVEARWTLDDDPEATPRVTTGEVGLDVREVQAVRRR